MWSLRLKSDATIAGIFQEPSFISYSIDLFCGVERRGNAARKLLGN